MDIFSLTGIKMGSGAVVSEGDHIESDCGQREMEAQAQRPSIVTGRRQEVIQTPGYTQSNPNKSTARERKNQKQQSQVHTHADLSLPSQRQSLRNLLLRNIHTMCLFFSQYLFHDLTSAVNFTALFMTATFHSSPPRQANFLRWPLFNLRSYPQIPHYQISSLELLQEELHSRSTGSSKLQKGAVVLAPSLS